VPQAALLSIGELSRRTGMSVSAIRFYESRGLVKAVRTRGNQRRFLRADIRRLSFALIAQQLGLTLAEIEVELSTLPLARAPTRQDWQAISRRIRGTIQARIDLLQSTRERLDGCIGCGCLSLAKCRLYNPDDRAARGGAGPRFLLGDRPQDFEPAAASGPGSAGRPRPPTDPTRSRRSRHSRRGGPD
jgi:MerR family redox-sensitive transcriptional activator SoxR